jgi:predicted CXXCH cytochrome family protein
MEDMKSKHAPVLAGECTECHSPHKAKLETLLLADYPDLCLSCHTDMKEKLLPEEKQKLPKGIGGGKDQNAEPPPGEDMPVYIHAPSDITHCETCHAPHFSEELALLVEPVQALCGSCHNYNEPSFGEAHINIDVNVMDCRRCHAPHYSKDPKLFKDEIHSPFANRTCTDCHLVEKP